MKDSEKRDSGFTFEQVRRDLALLFVAGGWLGAMGLGIYAVTEFDPQKGHFAPQWVGLGYIFLVGIAIAASTARSRMRMTDTIVKAFETGQKIADERWEAVLGVPAIAEAQKEIEDHANGHGDHTTNGSQQ